MLSAGFLDADLAIFLAHQFFKLPLLPTLLFRRLLVKASLFDFLEKSLFGDGSLETLQQLFWGFPTSQCHSDQVGPLSLTGVRSRKSPAITPDPIRRFQPPLRFRKLLSAKFEAKGNCRGKPIVWQGKQKIGGTSCRIHPDSALDRSSGKPQDPPRGLTGEHSWE